MIRILHIITDSNIGGAGHYLLTLIDKMDKQKFEIEAALPEGSLLCPALSERGVPFTEVPRIAERSFSSAGVGELYKVIKKVKPGIVHTHASLSGRVAARLAGGCWIIYTRHSVFPPRGNKRLNRWVNDFFSDAIIAVSPAARDNLLAEGASDAKIKVIFNGTHPEKECTELERAELRKKYGVPPDIFAAAQVARLTEVKGQEYVLDAAKMLAGENILFLLAGDGDSREYLSKRITDEKINNVRLLGFINEVTEINNLMDIQINASYGTEATSLSLLNGMSLGKPAVATGYGGNPYVIADGVNGLLVPCRSPESIRDAVLKLKNDRALYQRLSDGARKEYAERFTAEKMAAETQRVYEER